MIAVTLPMLFLLAALGGAVGGTIGWHAHAR